MQGGDDGVLARTAADVADDGPAVLRHNVRHVLALE
jgi:hypothetical protein